MRPELLIPSAKSAFNRLTSGELLHEEELHELGVQHVGLVTHTENKGIVFERIILGEPIPDTQRTVFNKNVEEDVMHLTSDPNSITGSIGFIDFVEERNEYGSQELQRRYGREIHITYVGIEVDQRGGAAIRRLFEGLKLIAQRRRVNYISAEVHSHQFSKVFPVFKRLGFRKGTTLNDGRVRISCELADR